MAKIRVTETRIWEYEPNLKDDCYVEAEASNLDEAMEEDQRCYIEEGVGLDEIAGNWPEISAVWEIID